VGTKLGIAELKFYFDNKDRICFCWSMKVGIILHW